MIDVRDVACSLAPEVGAQSGMTPSSTASALCPSWHFGGIAQTTTERRTRAFGETEQTLDKSDMSTTQNMMKITMSVGAVGTSGFGSAPRSRENPFMAAEPLFRSAATRTVETTEQKNERWMEGDCQSKLKIMNLGPRRSRSGRSRCLEDLRKFLECCRRGEAPSTAQR
mmetsp:Transcript_97104/g.273897  ORF Transcript_97104/g.273897 Transcript_97104/m.273897 type:complete len:169 (+) Transcript_97104:956-1462(+)